MHTSAHTHGYKTGFPVETLAKHGAEREKLDNPPCYHHVCIKLHVDKRAVSFPKEAAQ
jgi:hypothetical protein